MGRQPRNACNPLMHPSPHARDSHTIKEHNSVRILFTVGYHRRVFVRYPSLSTHVEYLKTAIGDSNVFRSALYFSLHPNSVLRCTHRPSFLHLYIPLCIDFISVIVSVAIVDLLIDARSRIIRAAVLLDSLCVLAPFATLATLAAFASFASFAAVAPAASKRGK